MVQEKKMYRLGYKSRKANKSWTSNWFKSKAWIILAKVAFQDVFPQRKYYIEESNYEGVSRYEVACDFCAIGSVEIDADNIDRASDEIRLVGWSIIPIKGIDYHMCPDCSREES